MLGYHYGFKGRGRYAKCIRMRPPFDGITATDLPATRQGWTLPAR